MRKSILLVEDEPADAQLLKRAMVRIDSEIHIELAEDGVEAVEKFGLDQGSEILRMEEPCCVILDLKMRRMDGFEVLKRLKENGRWKHVPIIIFTSSSDPNDIRRAYDCGANSYIVKPVKVVDLGEIARRICEYWGKTNLTPSASGRR